MYHLEMNMTKTIKTLLIFLPLIFLIGCGPSEEEIREQIRLELEQEKLAQQQALEEQKKMQKEQRRKIIRNWYEARSLLANLKNGYGYGLTQDEMGRSIALYMRTSIKITGDEKTLVYRDAQGQFGDILKAVKRLAPEMGIPKSILSKIMSSRIINKSLFRDSYENVDIEYSIRCFDDRLASDCSIKITLDLND